MNKRGNILDLLLHPLFEAGVAGLVLIAILVALNAAFDDDVYAARFHSANVALLLEAVQSVPRELNFHIFYPVEGWNISIQPFEVHATGVDVDESFPFSMNPDFTVGSYEGGDFLAISRSGRSLSISDYSTFEFEDSVYCPRTNASFNTVAIDSSSFSSRLIDYGFFTTDDSPVAVGFMSVPDGVRIYMNEHASVLACYLMRSFVESNEPSSINAVPINFNLLREGDARMFIDKDVPAVMIGFADNIPESYVENAVVEGLRAYGLV